MYVVRRTTKVSVRVTGKFWSKFSNDTIDDIASSDGVCNKYYIDSVPSSHALLATNELVSPKFENILEVVGLGWCFRSDLHVEDLGKMDRVLFLQ
jgi:hypothetical protein